MIDCCYSSCNYSAGLTFPAILVPWPRELVLLQSKLSGRDGGYARKFCVNSVNLIAYCDHLSFITAYFHKNTSGRCDITQKTML
jgi:hypothetical protein